MQKHPFSAGVITTLAVGAILSPLASSVLLGSLVQYQEHPFGVQAQVRRHAAEDRADRSQQRRAHKMAIDDCRRRMPMDQDATCVDVNDRSTYQEFFDALAGDAAGDAGTRSMRSRLATLPERDRLLVEQAAESGECVLGLVSRGLYRYCEELRREMGGEDVPDRTVRTVRSEQDPVRQLRARIRQADELHHGSAPEGRGDYRLR